MTPVTDCIRRAMELDGKATKGPWRFEYDHELVHPNDPYTRICEMFSCPDIWSEQAVTDDQANAEFIAFSRTALPKVCEALKICMRAFDDIGDQKQLSGVHDNLSALAFAARLELCQMAKAEALQKINKLFDDADGG